MRSIEADVVVMGEKSGFSGKPVCKYMCVYALLFTVSRRDFCELVPPRVKLSTNIRCRLVLCMFVRNVNNYLHNSRNAVFFVYLVIVNDCGRCEWGKREGRKRQDGESDEGERRMGGEIEIHEKEIWVRWGVARRWELFLLPLYCLFCDLAAMVDLVFFCCGFCAA